MQYADGATPLEPDEIAGLLHKHVTNRSELDQLEQANIEDGLQWLAKQKSPDILTEYFLKKLHQKLFGQVWKWAGTFRLTEKNIGVDPFKIAIELRNLFEDTRYWLEHHTYVPKEIAARFHHRLVLIHPFPNGNGRHARIIADAILTKKFNLKGINWSGGYEGAKIQGRRREYINALRAADNGNINLLLQFVKFDNLGNAYDTTT